MVFLVQVYVWCGCMGIGPGVDCLGSGDVIDVWSVDVVQWSRYVWAGFEFCGRGG